MNRISQYLVYPVVRFLSAIFLKIEFKNPDGFKPIIGKPAIIIANHISFYDSFLLRLNSDWIRLSVFFMGVTRFNHLYMKVLWYTGIIPLVYLFFGVFVVIPGQGIEKNLIVPRKLLEKGNHVFIFPEGSMNNSGLLKPFKIGAATLVAMTHVPVLPISYNEVYELGKRKKIIITIGQIINFDPHTTPEAINSVMEQTVKSMLG